MRKVILLAVVALIAGSAQAQFKPEAGAFCMELQFRPLGFNPIQTPSTLDFGVPMEGISAKYFVTDKVELRLDFGFGFNSDKDVNRAPTGQTTLVDETTKDSQSEFGFNVGVNYHFNGTERISPYVGALIGCALGSWNTNISNLGHISGDKFLLKGGWFGFQFSVATGFNWYIVNGLYLGAEVGLGLGFDKPTKTKTSTTQGGTSVDVTVEPTSSAFGVNFLANPAIRLGWKF